MFLDARELSHEHTLDTQVCIVGAGAAGISLALGLRDSKLDVLLLEAGGLEFESKSQRFYAGEVADERLHSPPDRYRQRRFGGTTTVWGGRCTPLDPIDLETRDYVPHSGWPLNFQTLLPFYHRANALCEAGPFAYKLHEAFKSPLPAMLPGFASEHFSTDTLERFSCPTDFGRRYAHKLQSAPRTRVLLHASATHIRLDETGRRVSSLVVQSPEGKTCAVHADRFVLATGGLEVPRLLLASRDVHASGVGNAHDVVGRYYMCHLAGTIGSLRFKAPSTDMIWHGYDVSEEGVYCRRRLALRPEIQRAQGLANFIARLHHPRITDPAHRNAALSLLYLSRYAIPYEYRKRLHGEEAGGMRSWLEHAWNVISRPHDAVGFAWHMLRGRKLAERKFPSVIIRPRANLFSLEFHAEQRPYAASRITLTDRLDTLGIPRIKVDWRYTADDVDSIARTLQLMSADFTRSGIGTFDYDQTMVEAEITRYGAYGGHHIGTARMGKDSRTSVVNADCRVHGVANLYIASAATFPTSSQANPTLTVVALALRLAEHLQKVRTEDVPELRPIISVTAA